MYSLRPLLTAKKKKIRVFTSLSPKIFAYYCLGQYKALQKTNVQFPTIFEFLLKTAKDIDWKTMRS